MLLHPNLQDKEIPHRDRLQEGIVEQWHGWFDSLKRELAVCLFLHSALHSSFKEVLPGCISLTADIWSSRNFTSYLALTCHWVSIRVPSATVSLQTPLTAFT